MELTFQLMRDDQFWRNQSEGLAIFIAEGFFRYIKLPFTPEKECIVNNSFYLINLLRVLNTNSKDEFYLLLIRRDKTKLYKADTRGLQELEAEALLQINRLDWGMDYASDPAAGEHFIKPTVDLHLQLRAEKN